MSGRKNPVLPEFVEKIERLDSPRVKVDRSKHRSDLSVFVGSTEVLELMICKSNSGRTCQISGHSSLLGVHNLEDRTNYARISVTLHEWDPLKMRQILMCALAGEATQGRSVVTSRGAVLLRELRLDPKAKVPAIIERLLIDIQALYLTAMGGEDNDRRVTEVRKLLDLLADVVTEEDILTWYREAKVKKVMES